jgi:hypothetical protein
MVSTLALLRRLTTQNVDFVLVGGMAAIAHGSSAVTEDVDVLIQFELETLDRVLRALAPVTPRLRMTPERRALGVDPAEYLGWRNLYVTTDEGVIDFLGALTGLGEYPAIRAASVSMQVADFSCQVLSLADLITSKRALGRPKDLRVALELERVRAKAQA